MTSNLQFTICYRGLQDIQFSEQLCTCQNQSLTSSHFSSFFTLVPVQYVLHTLRDELYELYGGFFFTISLGNYLQNQSAVLQCCTRQLTALEQRLKITIKTAATEMIFIGCTDLHFIQIIQLYKDFKTCLSIQWKFYRIFKNQTAHRRAVRMIPIWHSQLYGPEQGAIILMYGWGSC